MNTELEKIHLASIFNLCKSKAPELPVGEHKVDFNLRIRGTLKQGAEHDSEVSMVVPWKELCMVFASKLNAVTVEAMQEIMVRAIALKNVEETEAYTTELDNVKTVAETAIANIQKATKKKVKGKLTGKLVAELIP